MTKVVIKTVLVSCIIFIFLSCEKEKVFLGIDDISIENYPRVDGSTSAEPLNLIIAASGVAV